MKTISFFTKIGATGIAVLALFISLSPHVSAATYDIDGAGDYHYGVSFEEGTAFGFSYSGTVTLPSSAPANSAVTIYTERPGAFLGDYFSCSPNCGLAVRINGRIASYPDIMRSLLMPFVVAGTSTLNTGTTTGFTNVIIEAGPSGAPIFGCGNGNNFCTLDSPVQILIPITITSPCSPVGSIYNYVSFRPNGHPLYYEDGEWLDGGGPEWGVPAWVGGAALPSYFTYPYDLGNNIQATSRTSMQCIAPPADNCLVETFFNPGAGPEPGTTYPLNPGESTPSINTTPPQHTALCTTEGNAVCSSTGNLTANTIYSCSLPPSVQLYFSFLDMIKSWF